MGLARVEFIGRLTKDPEVRTTKNGAPVASFTVAVDEDFVGPDGVRGADYYDCVTFRKLAETVGKHLSKGRLVYVSGRPKERKWDTEKDGVPFTQRKTEYILEEVRFLDSKGNAPAPAMAVVSDEDIPF